MARKWQKSVIFEWNFALFLSFFMDSGHIYVPSGVFWDFSSRTHIGDLVMNLFLLCGPPSMAWVSPKKANLGPKMAEHDSFSTFQCGSKKSKMANLTMKL